MISLVTPSYNQAKYIEETILSVIRSKERLKSLQYVIIDGGSTDATTEIIKKYDAQLDYWVSEPDEGQIDAILKGLKATSNDVFNWLNSDDYLLAGTLDSLNTIITKYPQFDIYAFVGAGSGELGAVTAWFSFWPNMKFDLSSFQISFAQESTFIRRTFLEKNNIEIDKSYKNIFDTVLYREMLLKNANVLFINVIGGVIRHHDLAKTSLGSPNSDKEKFADFNQKNFNYRQLIWLRVTKTRFRSLLKFLFSIYLIRAILICVFSLRTSEYFICNFTGNDINSPNSWEIKKH